MIIHIGNYRPFDERKFKVMGTLFNYSFTTSLQKCDLRIIVDPTSLNSLNPTRDLVLLMEPQVVRPDLYRKAFLSNFKLLLPLGKYRAERLGLNYYFREPVVLPTYERDENISREKRIAIINEHKFSSSSRSMYRLRRKVIMKLEKENKGFLDLYGKEWNVGLSLELRRRLFALRMNKNIRDISFREVFSDFAYKYKSNVGHAHYQGEILQHYLQSIVIENDLDYVSEKIWKSIYSGAVPTYVGPSLEHDLLPKSILNIAAPDVDSVVGMTLNIEPQVLREKAEAGYEFLKSDEFEFYKAEYCYREFWANLTKLINSF